MVIDPISVTVSFKENQGHMASATLKLTLKVIELSHLRIGRETLPESIFICVTDMVSRSVDSKHNYLMPGLNWIQ